MKLINNILNSLWINLEKGDELLIKIGTSNFGVYNKIESLKNDIINHFRPNFPRI